MISYELQSLCSSITLLRITQTKISSKEVGHMLTTVCHACTQFEALLTLGVLQSLPIDLHEYCSTQNTSTGANTCNEAHMYADRRA